MMDAESIRETKQAAIGRGEAWFRFQVIRRPDAPRQGSRYDIAGPISEEDLTAIVDVLNRKQASHGTAERGRAKK